MPELDNKAQIDQYVLQHYPKTFKGKEILVRENKNVYYISTNRDASPLIINKKSII